MHKLPSLVRLQYVGRMWHIVLIGLALWRLQPNLLPHPQVLHVLVASSTIVQTKKCLQYILIQILLTMHDVEDMSNLQMLRGKQWILVRSEIELTTYCDIKERFQGLRNTAIQCVNFTDVCGNVEYDTTHVNNNVLVRILRDFLTSRRTRNKFLVKLPAIMEVQRECSIFSRLLYALDRVSYLLCHLNPNMIAATQHT